jgi:hypothetical protein
MDPYVQVVGAWEGEEEVQHLKSSSVSKNRNHKILKYRKVLMKLRKIYRTYSHLDSLLWMNNSYHYKQFG